MLQQGTAANSESDVTSSSEEPESNSDGLRDINSRLKGHARSMADFLDGKRVHPVWKPATTQDGISAWDEADLNRLVALRLLQSPSYSNPDMLLHHIGNLESLDPSFADRIGHILGGNDHVYLSNASGTGKTRMIFELLSRRWGLYLTCFAHHASDPYGSVDVSRAISDVETHPFVDGKFTEDVPLSPRMQRRWLDALAENRRLARHFFRRLILTRLLLLNEFHKLVTQRGISDDEARAKWLLAQLRPSLLLGHDLSELLFLRVRSLNEDVVTRTLATLWADLQSKISIVAIDEAQIALNTYRSAFASTDNRNHAPVLRELLICIGEVCPAARVVVSGVQLDLRTVSEAIEASNFSHRTVQHYHSFGYFGNSRQCNSFIRHFLGEAVSDADCEEVFRWLHGRHRIINVLVMLTLRFGARNIRLVLYNLVFRLTGYQRPGVALLNGRLLTGLRTIITDKLIESSRVAFVLRSALLTYAIHHRTTTTDVYSLDLVRMALALYGESAATAFVFEPFILLNIARWLAGSALYGVHGVIRHRLKHSTPYPLRTVAFAEGLAPCFWAALHTVPTLSELLVFPGHAPQWVRHPARPVLPRLAHRTSRFGTAPQDGTLIRVADTSQDVFAWLNHASEPFLIPDRGLGADLLFFLEIWEAQHVLVIVHIDPFVADRPRRDHRVVPSSPDLLYKQDSDARAQFLDVLRSLPPIPLHVGGRGSRSKARPRSAKFSTLHLLCFEEPFHPQAYDPPVANIDFTCLLRLSARSNLLAS